MASTTETDRRRAVTQTLANWRIEGFEPDAQYLALLERYMAGELTLAELGACIDGVTSCEHCPPTQVLR